MSFITPFKKNTFDKQNQGCFFMSIYEAIATMRALSKQGKTFSFSFLSYSHSRDESSGIVEVSQGRLRKRGKVDFNKYAELQEEYINVLNGEPRRFWHCCLLSLNGQSLSFTTNEN